MRPVAPKASSCCRPSHKKQFVRTITLHSWPVSFSEAALPSPLNHRAGRPAHKREHNGDMSSSSACTSVLPLCSSLCVLPPNSSSCLLIPSSELLPAVLIQPSGPSAVLSAVLNQQPGRVKCCQLSSSNRRPGRRRGIWLHVEDALAQVARDGQYNRSRRQWA